jgi:hypothetical protein
MMNIALKRTTEAQRHRERRGVMALGALCVSVSLWFK